VHLGNIKDICFYDFNLWFLCLFRKLYCMYCK